MILAMTSQVIYARVPETVKDATESYASERGMTLTNAVVDLIDRGLSAVQDERSIAELETRVVRLAGEKTEVERELQTAKHALDGVSERIGRKVCSCPSCKADVSGYDLLVSFQCPACHAGLSNLFQGGLGNAGLDNGDILVLLAAVGALLGAAWLVSKS